MESKEVSSVRFFRRQSWGKAR